MLIETTDSVLDLYRRLDALVMDVSRVVFGATRFGTTVSMVDVVAIVRADLGDSSKPDRDVERTVVDHESAEAWAATVDYAVERTVEFHGERSQGRVFTVADFLARR